MISRSDQLQRIRVVSAAMQKEANKQASETAESNQELSGYKALGLAANGKLGHVMSDEYRSDVALAAVEDALRQKAFEGKLHSLRADEAKKAMVQQGKVTERVQKSLDSQNEAAGYSLHQTDVAAVWIHSPQRTHVHDTLLSRAASAWKPHDIHTS